MGMEGVECRIQTWDGNARCGMLDTNVGWECKGYLVSNWDKYIMNIICAL